MPLSDTPRKLGGVRVLARSHRKGLYNYHPAQGAGGMGVDAESLDSDWFTTDYRAGDGIIFHSLTVHESLPNLTPDRMRLAVDYRYQAMSEPILDTFLLPHYAASWDSIYCGWQSTDLQYYWQKQNVKLGERDWKYYDQRDAEALELARRGDETARATLNRIIVRDTRPQKRRAVEQTLRILNAASESGVAPGKGRNQM